MCGRAPVSATAGAARKLLRVLVFPGGSEIGLEINRALGQCKDVELYSASADMSNHASFVFSRHFVIPPISEPGWVEALNALVRRHGIDYVFPAHDDVLVALVEQAETLAAAVVSSPRETCVLTRSKSATYQHLADVVDVRSEEHTSELQSPI